MNRKLFFGLLVLVLAFILIGCDEENDMDNPVILSYSCSVNSITYSIKIIDNSNYELTVGDKKSKGSASKNGDTWTFVPNEGETFTVVINSSTITAIEGTITFTDGTTIEGPGIINTTPAENERIITFNLDGGNVNGNENAIKINIELGKSIENLPNPKKENCVFCGWFSQKNGSGNQFTKMTKVNESKDVYPNWIEMGIVNLGGTLSVNNQQVYLESGQPFTGNYTVNWEYVNGTAIITNGKLNFSLSTPNSLMPLADYFDDESNYQLSDSSVLYAEFYYGDGDSNRRLERYRRSDNSSETIRYLYVNKDVIVTGEFMEEYEDGEGGKNIYVLQANMHLKQGWNTFYNREDFSTNNSEINIFYCLLANPSSINWILSDGP